MTDNKKLVTHNGTFHTDDIFAAATLSILLEKEGTSFEIVRTRDENIIKESDYVFDVGGIYDPETNRFDHHQVGGAGSRDNGIEYASFGLVWKKFGLEIAGSQSGAEWIDKVLVAPIDAHDNGVNLVEKKSETFPFLIQDVFALMRPTWREGDANEDAIFSQAVAIAKGILLRGITQAADVELAEQAVKSIYENSSDKKIIILDKNYPFQHALNDFTEPLFVVYPRASDGFWAVKAVRKDLKDFANRKDFPKPWAGLRDEELKKSSGVPDAVFCHRALFMSVAKSREGAIKLAQIAVES